jgi:hypothetical protein
MKPFVLKSVVFSLILVTSILGIFCLADGSTDPFYEKVASPKQSSLIIGTSRSSQGIRPDVIENIFSQNGQELKLFNFSFTHSHSPYGPVYLNSIKNKLQDSSDPDLFIVAIDPWSISAKIEAPDDISEFRENSLFLNQLSSVGQHPNVEYLLFHYGRPYYEIIEYRFIKKNLKARVHSDGWLEISVPMDKKNADSRLTKKYRHYVKNHLSKLSLSHVRVEYLFKTIAFLKTKGNVYLVRLPVHKKFEELEKQFMPDFESFADSIATELNVPYLSLMERNSEFQYTDGNHLYKESAAIVSKIIANWIIELRTSETH